MQKQVCQKKFAMRINWLQTLRGSLDGDYKQIVQREHYDG